MELAFDRCELILTPLPTPLSFLAKRQPTHRFAIKNKFNELFSVSSFLIAALVEVDSQLKLADSISTHIHKVSVRKKG